MSQEARRQGPPTPRLRRRRSAAAALLGLAAALALGVPAAQGAELPDSRGWELVSPVDKNGGQIDPPGAIRGGGALQAAADGQSVTYGSTASFGAGAQGAPPASQYISRREAGSWSTANITVPLFAGSYGTEPEGVPYRLFSPDLARGLLLNGVHCRGEGEGCGVANPPLPGSGAPVGYRDYYLREDATGGFTTLLGATDVAVNDLDPAQFELSLAGASADLGHVVLSSCAALTPDATEAPLGEGCDPGKANLYEWSAAAGLSLLNPLPGAELGAQGGAVSADGSRVYFTQGGDLYLREGATTKQVDESQGGGGVFQTASADGSVAFFADGPSGDEALYRYDATSGTSEQVAGEVVGVLGASEDGSHLYYLTAAGLFLWHSGATTEVAETADPSNYPPSTGTARVSADGTRLAFLSTVPLTGYDNTDRNTGEPDTEAYLYDAAGNGGAGTLTCASCRASGTRPIGPSTIPGAIANGEGPGATDSYKPRALAADGRRLFFDSRDALVAADTNNDADVYEWEAGGEGSCARAAGCVSLISSGRAEGGAAFVDASADGSDAFFLTDGSLVPSDPGSVDLYDARVGGGFAAAEEPIPCEGNACQGLLSEPVDPPLDTLLAGLGNPPVHYSGEGGRCKKGEVRRRGKCVHRDRHHKKRRQVKHHRRKRAGR